MTGSLSQHDVVRLMADPSPDVRAETTAQIAAQYDRKVPSKIGRTNFPSLSLVRSYTLFVAAELGFRILLNVKQELTPASDNRQLEALCALAACGTPAFGAA